MQKTDIAFYLLTLGGVVKEVTNAYTSSKSGQPTDWILIGLVIASGLIYAFYDKLTSTTPVPAPVV